MCEVSVLQVIGELQKALGDRLNGRITKAAGLFQAGQVCYLGENEWKVFSQSHPGESYTVTFSLNWHCTCPDWQHGAPALDDFYGGSGPMNKVCKHVLAACLSWQIDSPEACERPHTCTDPLRGSAGPQPVLTIPAWLVTPASHDAADMGHEPPARDTAASDADFFGAVWNDRN